MRAARLLSCSDQPNTNPEPDMKRTRSSESIRAEPREPAKDPPSLPKPDVSRMGYNPANFAYWIGEEPWVPGYSVSYAISFYDSLTQVESARSAWWGPKTDPKKLYGGFGLIR